MQEKGHEVDCKTGGQEGVLGIVSHQFVCGMQYAWVCNCNYGWGDVLGPVILEL